MNTTSINTITYRLRQAVAVLWSEQFLVSALRILYEDIVSVWMPEYAIEIDHTIIRKARLTD